MTALQEDVLVAVAARAEALVAQDWALVDGQLHPDFVYTNSRGERLTRAAYLEFLRHGPLRWRRQWLEDASVVVSGGTAVVTGVVVDDWWSMVSRTCCGSPRPRPTCCSTADGATWPVRLPRWNRID